MQTEPETEKIKVYKITNPLWVAQFAPVIADFCQKAPLPNVNYHSLVVLFERTAQLGGPFAELWVAMKDNAPVAFARWCIRDMPAVGTVHMDYLYSSAKDKNVTLALVAEFVKFGERHNSPWYSMDVVPNGKVKTHFKQLAEHFGFEMTEQPYVPMIARRKEKKDG